VTATRSAPAAGLTDADKMRLLPWSYTHGAFNSCFSVLTFFGPVFVLFLDELGLPKTRIGVLLSLLPFCGLMAPFIAVPVARIGVKRVFITCWGARKLVAALLLLTPWMLERHGADAAFVLVAGVVAAFALLRAVAETAWYPWFQEVVPLHYRGRYGGVNNFLALLGGCASLGLAAYVLDAVPGLQRFMWLIGTGVVCGVICVLAALRIPCGAPDRRLDEKPLLGMLGVLRDRRFGGYLAYSALTMVTMNSLLGAFVPLFMKEQVGISERQIIYLQVAGYVAGLLSSHAWGALADRRGGKRVLLTTLLALLSLPAGYALLPRQHPLSFALALILAMGAGALVAGWWIADQRMLYAELVDPARRTEYLAVYYAWIGLIGGCGPIAVGAFLDRFQGLAGSWGIFSVGPYQPLFLTGCLLLVGARMLLSRLSCDEPPGDPVQMSGQRS
jgi:hypothetical protein